MLCRRMQLSQFLDVAMALAVGLVGHRRPLQQRPRVALPHNVRGRVRVASARPRRALAERFLARRHAGSYELGCKPPPIPERYPS